MDKGNNQKQELDKVKKDRRKIKNVKSNTFQYSKALERATQSLKMIDISNKLKLAENRAVLNNEKMLNVINPNFYTNQLQTLMPNYDYMFDKLRTFTGIDKMCMMMGDIARQQLSFCSESVARAMTSSISGILSQIAETQKIFMNTIVERMNNMAPIFQELTDSLNEARANPNSRLNWMNYYDKLSEFFWIMPYKMTADELYDILQNVSTEKEFDVLLNKYFNKAKVNMLTTDITNMLINRNQRKMFAQIMKAYNDKSYALASVGLTTMIDNLLSYYLLDKGCTSRVGIFEPILKELEIDNEESFIVMMVNSNINLLYEKIEFNSKISINTNKKTRRNPISHGKSYSYKKIDTIMLLNTMYYLLVIQEELKAYKNNLYYNGNKKKFYILTSEKKKEIKNKIRVNKKKDCQ